MTITDLAITNFFVFLSAHLQTIIFFEIDALLANFQILQKAETKTFRKAKNLTNQDGTTGEVVIIQLMTNRRRPSQVFYKKAV